MTIIYTLANPKDGSIFYVGKSKNIEERLKRHIIESKSGKMNYRKGVILEILEEGGLPIIEEVETVDDSIASKTEAYWIRQFWAWGFHVCNKTCLDIYLADDYFFVLKHWLYGIEAKIKKIKQVVEERPDLTELKRNYYLSSLNLVWEEKKQQVFEELTRKTYSITKK